MKALLMIFCSKAGGERVFEPGPRPEAGLDACLRGEAGMALQQHRSVLPCILSNRTLLFRQFRMLRDHSKTKTELACEKAPVRLLVDGSMV